MRIRRWIIALLLCGSHTAQGDGNIDETNKYAWAANVGWVNVAPSNGSVTVHFDETSGYLSGHAWGENVGWIKLGDDSGGPYANDSATDWGVNLDGTGLLSGYAWGENVGWIKLDPTHGGVTIDTGSGAFAGYAWGENVGWLKFSGTAPDYGVRTLAFDTQAQGTPNWWLANTGVDENFDEGDGVPAWQEYIADTDPSDATSFLRIETVSHTPGGVDVQFSPASENRYYTLSRRADLPAGTWSDVPGNINIPGVGGINVLEDTGTATQQFYIYRIGVQVSP
ncbi:MAG: hypothetical protein VCG02_12415 [Verrucomicrobiota bacterium]